MGRWGAELPLSLCACAPAWETVLAWVCCPVSATFDATGEEAVWAGLSVLLRRGPLLPLCPWLGLAGFLNIASSRSFMSGQTILL